MEILTCRNCGSSALQTFLDLGESPLANELPIRPNIMQDSYPLRAQVCTDCWLAQQCTFVPDDIIYGGDYAFYSSTSPALVEYHARYAETLLERFYERAQRLTVEVACNDGSLLQHFYDAGCAVVGVDPASGPAEVCRARGINTLNRPFNVETAEWIRSELGPAGLLVANHVAAHIEDLDEFFGGIQHVLADDGVAVIEVQYIGDLITGNQIDHMYHEHRFWYSLTSFADVVSRRGLSVVDVEFTEPQGGSMMVTLSRGLSAYTDRTVRDIITLETWLRRAGTYLSMQGRADRICYQLRELIQREIRAGKSIAGYALSAKAVTLLNFCGLGPDEIDFIVDTTPAKIGRYAPGVGIPIVGPGGRVPDIYLLFVWNYLSSVLRREREFVDHGGRFIVPVPVPVLL